MYLSAKAKGEMPLSLASRTYASTAGCTLGFGPYRDSASAYLPLYLFRRASLGPPPSSRYFPCIPVICRLSCMSTQAQTQEVELT